jgi:hypothetical protein
MALPAGAARLRGTARTAHVEGERGDQWIRAEDVHGEEWADWIRLTPQERWLETERLWATFIALGGLL